tara:strand:- start:62 stop:271 length:210 start_codon:yes stop_codon:yes gene_type:complete
MMKTRCFVDVDGFVWSVDSDGETKYPMDTEIIGDRIRVLGEGNEIDGREIVDEYVLWPSLTDLASVLEQ